MDTSRRLVAISTAVGGFALVVALYRYYRAKTDDKNDGSARDSERSSGSGSEPKMPLLDSKKSVDFLLDESIARSRSLLRNTHVSNSGDCSESSSVTSDDRGLIKGYKTREDGSKTSYFSREISDADKKLLGDSSPQKISSSLLQQPRTNSATPESTPPRSGSKWNKAGTYEERDLKGWGKQTMEKLLTLVSLESPRERLKATICNVKIIECDCSISFARSKKRYMYDMTMSCDFVGRTSAYHTIHTSTNQLLN